MSCKDCEHRDAIIKRLQKAWRRFAKALGLPKQEDRLLFQHDLEAEAKKLKKQNEKLSSIIQRVATDAYQTLAWAAENEFGESGELLLSRAMAIMHVERAVRELIVRRDQTTDELSRLKGELDAYAAEIQGLRSDKRAADALAHAVAVHVDCNQLDARSRAADALLDYLHVGNPGGPTDVPSWVEEYEKSKSDV